MDAVGMDLQLSDRAYSEYKETHTVDEGVQEQQERHDSVQNTTQSSEERSSTYETSSDLATSSTVPLADFRVGGSKSTSSTSSSSSTDSRTMAASLYMPEYLTPSISYERQSGDQLLIALIGRAFDQPEKIATSLQQLVSKLPNTEIPVAKFTPFTVKRKALCRGNFDSTELKRHNLICLCYNASEARILLTGQDGYYTALLKQIEVLMGRLYTVYVILCSITHILNSFQVPIKLHSWYHTTVHLPTYPLAMLDHTHQMYRMQTFCLQY